MWPLVFSKDVTSQRSGCEVFSRSQEWHIHRYGFITILVLDTKGPEKAREFGKFVICLIWEIQLLSKDTDQKNFNLILQYAAWFSITLNLNGADFLVWLWWKMACFAGNAMTAVGLSAALMMKSPWLEVREMVVMTGPGYVWWNYCVSSNSQLFKFEVLDES